MHQQGFHRRLGGALMLLAGVGFASLVVFIAPQAEPHIVPVGAWLSFLLGILGAAVSRSNRYALGAVQILFLLAAAGFLYATGTWLIELNTRSELSRIPLFWVLIVHQLSIRLLGIWLCVRGFIRLNRKSMWGSRFTLPMLGVLVITMALGHLGDGYGVLLRNLNLRMLRVSLSLDRFLHFGFVGWRQWNLAVGICGAMLFWARGRQIQTWALKGLMTLSIVEVCLISWTAIELHAKLGIFYSPTEYRLLSAPWLQAYLAMSSCAVSFGLLAWLYHEMRIGRGDTGDQDDLSEIEEDM